MFVNSGQKDFAKFPNFDHCAGCGRKIWPTKQVNKPLLKPGSFYCTLCSVKFGNFTKFFWPLFTNNLEKAQIKLLVKKMLYKCLFTNLKVGRTQWIIRYVIMGWSTTKKFLNLEIQVLELRFVSCIGVWDDFDSSNMFPLWCYLISLDDQIWKEALPLEHCTIIFCFVTEEILRITARLQTREFGQAPILLQALSSHPHVYMILYSAEISFS